MPSRKPGAKPAAPSRSGTDDVDDFMRKLDHPLKAEIEAIRAIILGASQLISEDVKWNSPSFRTSEFFATINVGKDLIRVIFHLGAKVKDNSSAGLNIRDPAGLLEWPAAERGAVKFRDMKSVTDNRAAFEDIVRQWIKFVR